MSRRKKPRPEVQHAARMKSVTKLRTGVALLGFVPLLASLSCGWGLGLFCAIPPEWYLGIWAAILGTFIGLTIRLFRERRAYQRSR